MMKRFYIFSLFILFASASLASTQAFAQSAQEFYSQGNKLYNQKKYAEAIASYTRAIQAQPKSQPKAYLNSARAYLLERNYPAAVKYYEFYGSVEPSAETDKKFKAEYKDAQSKAKGATYTRDVSQTTVLKQLETQLAQNGPYLNRQGNGALAYYDVLLRAGYAEPHIYELQQKLMAGLSAEIEDDITPPDGQPLPNLDRTGWEFIRSKIEKTRQFPDVQPDTQRLAAIDATAQAWEAYYKGNYEESQKQFDLACQASPSIPAAHWGRIMLQFQTEKTSNILPTIDETEKIYQSAGIKDVNRYFYLLRAEAYRSKNQMSQALIWINKIQGEL